MILSITREDETFYTLIIGTYGDVPIIVPGEQFAYEGRLVVSDFQTDASSGNEMSGRGGDEPRMISRPSGPPSRAETGSNCTSRCRPECHLPECTAGWP